MRKLSSANSSPTDVWGWTTKHVDAVHGHTCVSLRKPACAQEDRPVRLRDLLLRDSQRETQRTPRVWMQPDSMYGGSGPAACLARQKRRTPDDPRLQPDGTSRPRDPEYDIPSDTTVLDGALYDLIRNEFMDMLDVQDMVASEVTFSKSEPLPVFLAPHKRTVPKRVTCSKRFTRRLGGDGATVLHQCILLVSLARPHQQRERVALRQWAAPTHHGAFSDTPEYPDSRTLRSWVSCVSHLRRVAEHGSVAPRRALHSRHLARPPTRLLYGQPKQGQPIRRRNRPASGDREKGVRCAPPELRVRDRG